MVLDRIDIALLENLQEDAKQTNKQLSLKLSLSVTAIYERIKKLERAGIIRKYVALIDRAKVDLGFTVFCHIKLVQHVHKSVVEFEREIVKLSEVMECYHVSGEYDYLLKVLVKDMDHFRDFMVKKLTKLDHIGSTQSSFTINEVKNTTALSF
ncbi:Lrp/AsnC family transcriptional regulator [Aureitalea sp. L0-47]|uniref:Lrp/AsnC family transcriptional regulator n=1 Tax=Aureitalea sp. L0-47 TaxID=2816962 RepID=UPI0022371988|nr:Lrp/AsnC family transcriptional regulator [Aureitalea sp. L0-47]MCW5520609.1 Lrp/AsnC family transcriptional regulator [Aureitalea sp. L0-47]